jgi:hypothetical protein
MTGDAQRLQVVEIVRVVHEPKLCAALVCIGLASLGSRHPLGAGALMLVPVTFPLGLGMAALSDVSSSWWIALVLAWFVAARSSKPAAGIERKAVDGDAP